MPAEHNNDPQASANVSGQPKRTGATFQFLFDVQRGAKRKQQPHPNAAALGNLSCMSLRVFCCSLVVALALLGQVSTSRLTGTVQDSSGAAIVGSGVTLRNEATGVSRTTLTTEAGTYTFDAIPTGMYTVEVEAKGFRKASLRSNEVNIGAPTTVNVTLEVGAVTETVSGRSATVRVISADLVNAPTLSQAMA